MKCYNHSFSTMAKLRQCVWILFVAVMVQAHAAIINVTPASNVTSIIAEAQENDEIVFSSGTYSSKIILGPILANNITLRGQSKDATKATILSGSVRFSFIAGLRPQGLTFKWLSFYGNNAIKQPRVQWIVGPQSTATYYGVDNFALVDCFIFGNLGAPGFRQQLGVALQGFGGTLTVTGNEFSQVGWGILELGNGGSFSSNGAYSKVLFDGNFIHNCYGGVNFRCNSTFPCATVSITNNLWRDISNTITDEAWPLKGFEAFNVKSLIVSNNVFDNIDRGAIGHGGASKGMAFEAFGIETIGISNNTIRNTAQGFSIRSGPTFGAFPCPSGAINDNFFEQVAFSMLNVSCNSIFGEGSINIARNAWDPDRGSGPQAGDIVFASASIQASTEASLFPWRATLDRDALNGGLARNCSVDCGVGRCDFLLATCYCANGGSMPSCTGSEVAPSSQNTLDPNGQSLSANPALAIALIVVLTVVIVGGVAFTIFQVRRYRNRTALSQRGQTYGTGK